LVGSHNNWQSIISLKTCGILTSLLLAFAYLPSHAQEQSGLGTEESFKGQDDVNQHIDHVGSPSASSNHSSSNNLVNKDKEHFRDSLSIKAATKNKPDTSSQKKPEDETLSFNLLYFIIQKFKVSEMVN